MKTQTTPGLTWGMTFSLPIIILFILPCPIFASSLHTIEMFSGKTMGTTYHIKVVMPLNKKSVHSSSHIKAKKSLQKDIDTRLKAVNRSMSVYSPKSEISRFNRTGKKDPFNISADFYSVMVTGQNLYNITHGAWDATLKPLVDLWGFGTEHQTAALPSPKTIEKRLERTGFNHIKIHTSPHALEKSLIDITLNLGSIAKGFGVDAVAGMLKEKGYGSFLVEIGGEVVAAGEKPSHAPWMVGVSRPDKGGNPNAVYKAFALRNRALATSGDYRNFITIEKKNYSHIINPVTGYPVSNGVVSTSVIAENCTFADGLATALMVMGPEKGIKLVNSLEKTESLIVVRSDDGALRDYFSRGFPKQ